MTHPPLTPEQHIRVRAMAKNECANYDRGNCLLLDNEETFPCLQTLCRGSLVCDYFIRAILPAHRELEYLLFGTRHKKACVVCGQVFYPRSNRAQYCGRCRDKMTRLRNRERKRRQRRLDVTE